MDLAREALLSFAQIALGFAGFTSIVIFERDPTAPWSGLDAFRTARMQRERHVVPQPSGDA